MRPIIFLLLAAACLSCKTSYINISVKEPAVVDLPPDLEVIGVVNRTLPSAKNKPADDIDKIFSAEGLNLDRDGAEACVKSLETELMKNDRFTFVGRVSAGNVESPGSGIFPAQLSWEEVERICNENEVQGLFVLEVYDTDSRVNYQAQNTEVKTPLGNVPAIEHLVTVNTRINTGWRIYDPALRLVLDEHAMYDDMVSRGRGINPIKAANAITGRAEAVKQRSTVLAANYAARISPYWIRVSRTYFTKGNNNFEIAKRRADAGNWDGAHELWLKETENPKAKLAGKACVNVAIIHEINGDLDQAIQWASKAWEDYGNKTGLEYLRTLKNRKQRIERLRNQEEY